VKSVTRLDDFLGPLHQGIWEITVGKDLVTEPLDSGWERSLINVPTPGTIASFRKGQYHVHETSTEWKVHLDRYDPKVHPFLHLVDDAPLLLMVADTFVTLVATARGTHGNYMDAELKEQKRTWQVLFLLGFALALVGIWIFADPLTTFSWIIHVLLPAGIIVLGLFVARKGISFMRRAIVSPGSFFLGISVVVLGIVTFDLPLDAFVQLLLLVLSFWAFGSAYMSFSRVARGRKAVPEGFFRRLGTGVLSFLLALGILLVPDAMLELLMDIFGILVFMLGIVISTSGWRLREKMRSSRANPANEAGR